jgi:hypothetical protein
MTESMTGATALHMETEAALSEGQEKYFGICQE